MSQLTVELLTNGIVLEKNNYTAFYTMFGDCQLDCVANDSELISCADDNPTVYRSFSSYTNMIYFKCATYYCKKHSRLLDDNNQCDICISEKGLENRG